MPAGDNPDWVWDAKRKGFVKKRKLSQRKGLK